MITIRGTIFVLTLQAAIVTSAGAQIRGELVDPSGTPVGGAVVTLLQDGVLVAATLSDSTGRFRFAAPAAGPYRVRVQRIGYGDRITEPFEVGPDGDHYVRLVLSLAAIHLDAITATVESPRRPDPRLDRRGFYDHRELYGEKMGFAQFFTRDDLELSIASRVTDVLRNVPALRVRSTGGRGVRVYPRPGCSGIAYYLDGMPLRVGDGSIDEYVNVSSVVAIEVYSSRTRPAQYQNGACMAVVLWTGVSDSPS